LPYCDRSNLFLKSGYAVGAACLLLWLGCQAPAGTGPVSGPPEPVDEEPSEVAVDEAGEAADAPHAEPAMAPLELVGSNETPPLLGALRGDLAGLVESLDRSLEWFEKPSSHEYFPLHGISHEHAWASVYAFRTLVTRIDDVQQLDRRIREHFDFFRSAGGDGRGTVLFTGYYAPTFDASRTRTEVYRYPLYRRPVDLVEDSVTGQMGRSFAGQIVPYATRAEIERAGMLAGSELAWLQDPFEVYLIHVQGSAALTLEDGSVMYISYDGNNGHEYVSVARELMADGKIAEDELSLDEVRGYFARHPEDLEPYLRRNPRYIFFREGNGSMWPVGSLGISLTPTRSLATDKELFPPGGVTFVVAFAPDESGRMKPIERFMLDQDSGGAIRTPGRADIYYGVGREAERRAGGQYSGGSLYYLFLKPDRVGEWSERLIQSTER
jgi:membrane-bound lytic murein transglycosylase A